MFVYISVLKQNYLLNERFRLLRKNWEARDTFPHIKLYMVEKPVSGI